MKCNAYIVGAYFENTNSKLPKLFGTNSFQFLIIITRMNQRFPFRFENITAFFRRTGNLAFVLVGTNLRLHSLKLNLFHLFDCN